MLYIIGGKIENQNVLFLNKEDDSVIGGEDLEVVKGLLPNLNGYHAAGTTWSTSATLYWMTFQPRIFGFKDMKEIEDALLDRRKKQFSSSFGRQMGLSLKEDYTANVIEECKLIDEGVNTAKPFYEKEA